MTQTKNRLFGRHFETEQLLLFSFLRIMIFYSAYGANLIAKFRWESDFLRGSIDPPRTNIRSESTLVTLSVNRFEMQITYTNTIRYRESIGCLDNMQVHYEFIGVPL